MDSLHILTGQTATGKTGRALKMAQASGADIISCDSRQIYRHLSCVTGKDIGIAPFTLVETFRACTIGYYEVDTIRIWGYDLVDPDVIFSSAEYVHCFNHIYTHTMDRGVPPIVVGGSYLYLQDVLYGVSSPVSQNHSLRAELANVSLEILQKRLQSCAPDVYKQLNNSDKNNPRRLMRRIEIAEAGDEDLLKPTRVNYKILSFIGLKHAHDDLLRIRIQKRVEERLLNGALDELEDIYKRGYSIKSPGCTATGYEHMYAYQSGKISSEELIEAWTLDEIRYAKRQYTFMKKDPHIQWELV